METKTCPRCNETLTIDNFGKNKCKNDGLQTYCNQCRKSINNEHYANSLKRRETVKNNNIKYKTELNNLVSAYKSSGCIICSEKELCTLDFHHVKPLEKSDSIGQMVSDRKSKTLVEEEIKKCVVLCANCHRKVHANILSIHV